MYLVGAFVAVYFVRAAEHLLGTRDLGIQYMENLVNE